MRFSGPFSALWPVCEPRLPAAGRHALSRRFPPTRCQSHTQRGALGRWASGTLFAPVCRKPRADSAARPWRAGTSTIAAWFAVTDQPRDGHQPAWLARAGAGHRTPGQSAWPGRCIHRARRHSWASGPSQLCSRGGRGGLSAIHGPRVLSRRSSRRFCVGGCRMIVRPGASDPNYGRSTDWRRGFWAWPANDAFPLRVPTARCCPGLCLLQVCGHQPVRFEYGANQRFARATRAIGSRPPLPAPIRSWALARRCP